MALLWKDFKQLEDCTGCPVKKAEYCSGGFVCYGGEPIEPPCCSFDDDTDLEQWVQQRELAQLRYEEAEDRRIEKQREKEAKNEQAQKLRREAKYHVWQETQEIKRLRKRISANEAAVRLAQSLSFAVNMTNEMFGYQERVKPKYEQEIDSQNEQYRQRIAELEAIKKEKLKQLRNERKDKEA